jgi:hypothetical protein
MFRIHRVSAFLSVLALMSAAPSGLQAAGPASACRLEVLVDGRVAAEYHAPDARYVEALKGKSYAIRIHNPFDVRVAVALSVDGLNTIDARRTTAAAARKWVIDPYQTVTISGWQTSMAQSRRFFFTSEERSYAGRLGQPDNIGVISAVFFRERVPVVLSPVFAPPGGAARSDAAKDAPAPAEQRAAGAAANAESAVQRREGFAATGIGERTDHPVVMVHLDLEERPAASIDIRYEYRGQLVRLGVLPAPVPADPLARRQNAQGFDKGFCPDIK